MFASNTRSICAAALVAAVAFSIFPARAQAQRMSLAERVERLEQQQGNTQNGVELVNQINALQAQVRSRQGQNEELRHQLDQLKQQSKDQYTDIDSRIGRLEGRAPGAAPAGAPPAPAAGGQLPDAQLGGNNSAPQNAAPRNAPPPNAAPPTNAPPANPADEKAAYDQAFGALKDGRYAESARALDRKSTRLNSSHANISYAVFCLKKKKTAKRRKFSPSHHQ